MTFGKPVVFAVDDYLPITGSLDRAGTTQLVDAKVLANTIVQ